MGRFIKLIVSIAICLLISVLLIPVLARNRDCTLGDLAYNRQINRNVNEVYIREGDKKIPFIVLEDKDNKTLLLRKEVMVTPKSIDSESSYYENSEIDSYLNSEYLKSLGGLGSHIILSNIDIMDYEAIGTSGNNVTNINRKVFLLSISNVTSGVIGSGNEGKIIKYFKDSKDECVNSWWVRTPNTFVLACTYSVKGNRVGSTNSYDLLGIRPAFYLASSTKVQKINDKYGSRIELVLD